MGNNPIEGLLVILFSLSIIRANGLKLSLSAPLKIRLPTAANIRLKRVRYTTAVYESVIWCEADGAVDDGETGCTWPCVFVRALVPTAHARAAVKRRVGINGFAPNARLRYADFVALMRHREMILATTSINWSLVWARRNHAITD